MVASQDRGQGRAVNFLRRQVAWAALIFGVLASAGCGDGQIELTNNTQADVGVQLGSGYVDEVLGDGGTVIYTDECYDGPIVVTFADERSVDLEGPICPGQELLIGDETAKLRASGRK